MWKCVGPLLLLVMGVACATSPAAQGPSTPSAGAAGSKAQRARQLAIANKPWKGDFDGMLERRMVRVAVPYSRSLYFIDKGRERGIAVELVRDFGDITVAESNIHGGAKYMDTLMTRHFADAKFDEQNRTLFAFAACNAGPGNISRMRKEAEKRGLDPNLWFNNAETVTTEKIGIETRTYVRNIFKYYVSYKLAVESGATAAKVRQQIVPAK